MLIKVTEIFLFFKGVKNVIHLSISNALKYLNEVKRLRTLLVNFSNDIPMHLITAFRASIIEKVGREEVTFHNHLGDAQYIYQYPLIQYKIAFGKPAIVCLEEGVDEIHKLFEQRNWKINLLGESIELKVDRLDLKTTTLNVWDKKFYYRLFRWQALNEKNYREYNNLKSLTEKIQMLERILTGNILSFAKGIEWQIDQPIKLSITDVSLERLNKMKDIKVAVLDIQFSCNVSLPEWIGLGKGVSKGFGVVRKSRSQNEE